MKLYFYLLTLPALLITLTLFSQSSKPGVSKEPAWITKRNIDYSNTSLDKEAQDGYIEMDFENQVYLAEQSEYFRRSKKILSQAGVQNGSEISVSFNPSFQQLIFHSIHILRSGAILDKLKLSNIKIVQQEKELDNFIYNGVLDAVLILDDVRKGDIIEYSYTIKGYNPIFKNKYADEYNMNFSVPLYEIYYKLVVPPGRKMNFKNDNQAPEPVLTTEHGQQVFEWNKKNIAPLPIQDYTPSWYDPNAKILVSEYTSWKEVNDWALELFPVKKELSSGVQNKIKEIETSCHTDAEKAQAALRFVQDDIRYMGIEMGVNSHRPADPSKVFAQRFGDCKEKSYLLSCMLRAMHIDASPVLINTVDKKNLENLLPSSRDFDHVTVRVKLDGVYYWYDPTIAFQRGDIKDLFYPDYQSGLVIADSTTALTSIAFRNNSYQHINEYFRVTDMKGNGTLTVTTTYKGADADRIRDDFNNSSIAELMTSYQKFYASYYEDIKADSITYTDNDSTGIFTSREYYSIPKFWMEEKDNRSIFSFSAFSINSTLRRVKEKQRHMPFSLVFPAKFRETLTIELPRTWTVTESDNQIKNTSYAYNYKFYCVDNIVHLDADYENLKDHVTVEEAPAYFKDIDLSQDFASFEISSGNDLATAKSTPAGNKSSSNFISFLVIGAIAIGVAWWNKRR